MKLGIMGTGLIAKECLTALTETPDASCGAICGRSGQAARRLAEQFKVERVYTDYRELLLDDTVDVIYIGILNHLHYTYVKEALEAGRHVICEKPFTATAAQARALAGLAEQKGLYLMEAISPLYTPNFSILAEQVKRLDGIRLVQCNYSQYSSRYDRYLKGEVLPVFDPACSGGALCDINIYNLHLILALFGSPFKAAYYPNLGPNGIDTSGIALLSYPDFLAESVGAKDSESPGGMLIQGKNGYIRVNGAPNVLDSLDVFIDGKQTHFHENRYSHRMAHEFAAFSRILREQDKKSCGEKLDHSLRAMQTLEQARLSAGIRFPEDTQPL